MRTRVKICGITNIADAKQAIESGADALGFVFYKPSPRYIKPELAADIIKSLPPFVTSVGLVVDMHSVELTKLLQKVPLDLIQFHGNESESECLSYNKPYIKAIRVKNESSIADAVSNYSNARSLLLDAYKEGVPGGTGEVFNWSSIPQSLARNIVLAGGLTTENISLAIKQVRPYAVDVSGGVELEKGVKDHAKVKKFIEEVASVN